MKIDCNEAMIYFKKHSISITTAVSFVIIFGIAYLYYGSMTGMMVAMRGGGITVDAQSKSFGRATAHRSVSVDFDLRNTSDKAVKIVGVRVTCTCMGVENEFPIVLGARSNQKLRVHALPPVDREKFRQALLLYTDLPSQREVALIVTGEVQMAGRETPGQVSRPD